MTSRSHVSRAEYAWRCTVRLFNQVQANELFILFFCSTLAWFSWYHHCFDKRIYAVRVSLVYIIGWIYTTKFTAFLQRTSEIIYAIRTILLLDVTVFFVIYGIQLLSFSLSTYILTVKDMMPEKEENLPFFKTINDMFSRMLRTEVDNCSMSFEDDSRYTHYVAGVLMLYVTISAVVLVKLPIAMMGHTYEDALEQTKLDVRVDNTLLGYAVMPRP